MREVGGPVNLAGPILESPDFWTGHNVNRTGFDLNGVGAVVLPAWSEHQPRRLLQAIANDIPVIASKACGLSGMQGVSEVEMGDVEALKASVEAALNRSSEVTA